jgi:hypothetical protein
MKRSEDHRTHHPPRPLNVLVVLMLKLGNSHVSSRHVDDITVSVVFSTIVRIVLVYPITRARSEI